MDKVPGKLKAIVKDRPLVHIVTLPNRVPLGNKGNIEELIAFYKAYADTYTVGWDEDGNLIIQFSKWGEDIVHVKVREILPEGLAFYKEHAGKDMFVAQIIDVLFHDDRYTRKIEEPVRQERNKTRKKEEKEEEEEENADN